MTRASTAIGRIAVISPHLDDGVFACGELLAARPGAVVITVFAGRPPTCAGVTEWDAASGFHAGDDVVGARREEDRRALAVLRATPLWLDFCDDQYGRSPSLARVSEALGEALRAVRPAAAFIPLGLFHRDHVLAHEAALAVRRRREAAVAPSRLSRSRGHAAPAQDDSHAAGGTMLQRRHHSDDGAPRGEAAVRWYVYADALYRRIPGVVEARIDALRRSGLSPAPARLTTGRAGGLKRCAILCYRSQLLALHTPGRPGVEDAFAEEAYWSLPA